MGFSAQRSKNTQYIYIYIYYKCVAILGNIFTRFGEVFAMIKKAFVPYLLVVLGTIVSSFIGSLGSIACVIGVLVTMPYAMAINGHFVFQTTNLLPARV